MDGSLLNPFPTLRATDIGFGTCGVGAPCDWASRTVELWGIQTTFTREVNADGTVTVTADCDPPDMMLLARKGDRDYWKRDKWTRSPQRRPDVDRGDLHDGCLQEGFVATGYDDNNAGIQTAIWVASSPLRLNVER